MTDHEMLIQLAREVVNPLPLSEPEFSAGTVGCALLAQSGKIFTGICIDLACGLGFCAEHAAIAEMLKARETQIRAIVAVGRTKVLSPCGRCREMMVQVDHRNLAADVIIAADKVVKLKELLPYHWSEVKNA